MKKNKVVALLTALSSKELKLFEKFVRNPHNNKKEAVIRLYEFIAKNHAAYNISKFTKAQCFLYVYPELKAQFDKLKGKTDELVTQKLKNPLSDLKKLIEEFIVQQELAVEKHDKTLLLIKGLFKRQMQDRAFQLVDKELMRLNSNIGEDFYHHFYQFRLLEFKERNFIQVEQEAIFSNMLNSLDLFYIHTKFVFGSEAILRKLHSGKNDDLLLFDELRNLISENKVENSTISIQLYQKTFDVILQNSHDKYLEVKKLYINNFSSIDGFCKISFLKHLINYCIRNRKINVKLFDEELFFLYDFGIRENLFLLNGYFQPYDFKNAVVLSTSLGKIDWAENFVISKSNLLSPSNKESNVLLAKAQIEGVKKNFSNLIDLLKDVEFIDVFDNLTSRSLMMRTYYEMKEFHTLEYFLDAFYKYIKRNNLIGTEVRESLLNSIVFTRFLIKSKYKNFKREDLKNKLNEFKIINNKSWFLKMIESFGD